MASAIHFDPYHKWLGIPPEEQPPHYYRLLGIKLFESDGDVIQSAADQRMAHVRTFQTGVHAGQSQRILNELASARVCLLKADKKAAYDAELKRKVAPPPAPPPSPTKSSASLPKAVPVAQAVSVPAPRLIAATATAEPELPFAADIAPMHRRRTQTKQTINMPLLIGGAIVVILLAAGGVWLAMSSKNSSIAANPPPKVNGGGLTPEKAQPPSPQPKTPPPTTTPTKPVQPESVETVATVPQPATPRRTVPSAIDNDDSAGFTKTGSDWERFENDGVSFKGTHLAHKAGDGQAAVIWTFDRLEPGKRYTLLASWHGHAAHATNARYLITGATHGVTAVQVNQRTGARPDTRANGHPFQKLATVTCFANTIAVRLTNAADNDVVADAILLVEGNGPNVRPDVAENPPIRSQPPQPQQPENPTVATKPPAPRKDDPTWLTQLGGPVTGIALLDGSEAIVTSVDAQNSASVWDLDDRIERRRIDNSRLPYLSVAVARRQRIVFLGAQNGIVSVWDLGDEQRPMVYTISAGVGPVTAVAAFPDGSSFAAGGRRVQLIRYNILRDLRSVNVNTITHWDGFTAPVTTLAVSPSGPRLVAGSGGTWLGDKSQASDDMKIHGYDVPTQETKDFDAHEGSVWSMALSADGDRLATASSDGKVRLWNTSSGTMLKEMSGHDGPALAVAMSADGHTIVSGGEDTTVRIWDARSGLPRSLLRGNTSAVRAIAYDEARQRIVTGGQNGELRLFDASQIPVAAATPENRTPLPSSEARDAAQKLVDDVFAADIAKAKSANEKGELADTLLTQAAKSEGAERFVLIEQARKLAVSAGDVVRALAAVKDLVEHFDLNTWETTRSTIDELAKSITTASARKHLAEAVVQQAEAAIAQEKYDEAKEMLTAALGVARKTNDSVLVRQITARGKEVVELGKSFETIRLATEAVKANPDDAEANLTLGKHFCFTRQDWESGLPHLAKGSDEKLAEAARQDSASPTKPDEQAKLADQWWELGNAAGRQVKSALLARAEHWYREALPQLSGLSQTKVNKRLEELSAQQETGETDPTGKPAELAAANAKSLAKKLKDAVKAKNLTRTALFGRSRNQQNMFTEVPPAGLLLVGFNYAVDSGTRVMSLRPIYAGVKQTTTGGHYGGDPQLGVSGKAIAPAGYAVGGLETYGGGFSSLNGFTIIYMKITKDGLDPNDTKRSGVIGTDGFGGATQTLAGDGQPVVGIFGSVRPGVAWLEGFGLIQIGK